MTDPLTIVREASAELGFDLVGVTSAEPLVDALASLDAWWRLGYGAEMKWMGRHPPERADPRTLLSATRAIVTLGVNYEQPAIPFRSEGRYGRVARYAWGQDYHDVLLPRLLALGETLVRRLHGARDFKVACDHSPLLERAAAARAGLGFFGKNTCLIRPRTGSYFFLAELLLDVEIPTGGQDGGEHCGSCSRCLADCPTGALPEPYVLDARRCVSYLTIEHRGPLPEALRALLGAWVFGCDDCQETCPFNRYDEEPLPFAQLAAASGPGARLDLVEVLAIATDEAFRERFAGTALLRPKREGLLRNASVVARNVRAHGAVDALTERVLTDASPVVRGHALWALHGLDPRVAGPLAVRLARDDPDPYVREEARRTSEIGIRDDADRPPG